MKKVKTTVGLTLAGLVFLAIGVGLGLYENSNSSRDKNAEKQVSTPQQTKQESTIKPTSLEGRWLMVGDVFWGRGNQLAIERNGSPAFLFETLSTFDKPSYDAWLANFECPITNQEISVADQEAQLRFNCRPAYLSEVAKWFEVTSLANNHTDNMDGQVGLDETRRHLETAGIQYFGHYDNAATDDICEVVSLPVRIQQSDSTEQNNLLPVALCGYHGVFKIATDAELDRIADYSDILPTIVMPHMGEEYVPTPDSLKTSQYRAMVDRGADVVVGGHPHWVQSTEVYKDTLIVYSLGNFLFDQKWSADVSRGMALDVVVSTNHDDNIAAWLQLGEECKAFKDACLEKARQQNLTKVEIAWQFDVIASDYSTGRTQKGDVTLQAAIEARTNWAQTLKKL